MVKLPVLNQQLMQHLRLIRPQLLGGAAIFVHLHLNLLLHVLVLPPAPPHTLAPSGLSAPRPRRLPRPARRLRPRHSRSDGLRREGWASCLRGPRRQQLARRESLSMNAATQMPSLQESVQAIISSLVRWWP